MDVQSVSHLQNLILSVESIACSVAQIFELIEGEQQRAWKRAQLCPGKLHSLSHPWREGVQQENAQAKAYWLFSEPHNYQNNCVLIL